MSNRHTNPGSESVLWCYNGSMKKILSILGFILMLGGCSVPANQVVKPMVKAVSPVTEASPGLYYPIAGFAENVTLKPFGIYITPKTSPVQPEKSYRGRCGNISRAAD